LGNLEKYGATERFLMEATLYPDYSLGRVVSQYKDLYKVVTEQGEYLAELSGKFHYETDDLADFPVVGDFVMLDRESGDDGNLIIHMVLTRKSALERSAVGVSHQTQVVAANIDVVFICMSLNNDYNLNRLERYLSVAWDSRATPVIVLTKADLCSDVPQILAEIASVALDTDVLITSIHDERSCKEVSSYLTEGVTTAFIGSSGVGKSTLINCLAGEELLPTAGLRNDDKGRHTTTRRELLILPQGGIVIDTPGMRELGLESADFSRSFADIEMLEAQCKFSDCTHTSEPGCAICRAIESGELDMRRFENYKKLKKEARYEGLGAKQIETLKLEEMFRDVGGMKKVRSYARQKNKHKR
jgi:ribosome biogenesis GTPase / thiamine phosphate phosphatase